MRTDLQRLKRDTESGRTAVATVAEPVSASFVSAASSAAAPLGAQAFPVSAVTAKPVANTVGPVVESSLSAATADRDVDAITNQRQPQESHRRSSRHRRRLIVTLILPPVRERIFGRPDPPRIQSLAVLPLNNLSNNAEPDFFADGMTEALTTDLGKISALRVISRTSVMRYKGTQSRCRK